MPSAYFVRYALLSCALFASLCEADVSLLRSQPSQQQQQHQRFGRPTTRLQRQEFGGAPYPAAGYRPSREFNLPSDAPRFVSPQQTTIDLPIFNDEQQASAPRPGALYSAPARLRQAPQKLQLTDAYAAPQRVYAAPQRAYAAPEPARLTAPKSERLTDNREDQEDEEDVAATDEIEVNVKPAEATPKPAASAPTTPAVAYYPAGAVSFVHPLAAYYQPAYSAAAANYLAQLQSLVTPAIAVAPAPAPASANPATVTAATTTSTTTTPAPALAPAASNASPAAAAAPAANAPAAATPAIAIAAPQYFASAPFVQQLSYSLPPQLQAW